MGIHDSTNIVRNFSGFTFFLLLVKGKTAVALSLKLSLPEILRAKLPEIHLPKSNIYTEKILVLCKTYLTPVTAYFTAKSTPSRSDHFRYLS